MTDHPAVWENTCGSPVCLSPAYCPFPWSWIAHSRPALFKNSVGVNVCLCKCMCKFVCVCAHTHMCFCEYMGWMSVYMCVCVRVCVHVHKYRLCEYMFVYVCACACLCLTVSVCVQEDQWRQTTVTTMCLGSSSTRYNPECVGSQKMTETTFHCSLSVWLELGFWQEPDWSS